MLRLYTLCALLLSLSFGDTLSTISDICSLYLAPSTIPGAARGIFAGRNFLLNDVITKNAAVEIHAEALIGTQLNNYVFHLNNKSVMILFGTGSLVNSHNSFYNVLFDESSINRDYSSLVVPFSLLSTKKVYSTDYISPGQELIMNYGETWFTDRDLVDSLNASNSSKDALSAPLEELSDIGVCLSHVGVNKSCIKGAGLGLYSTRAFKKGDLVTVSPVLVIPMPNIEASKDSSVLINYVITQRSAVVGILPIGEAAMINHATKIEANLEINWFDWSKAVGAKRKEMGRKSYTEVNISPDFTVKDLLDGSIIDLVEEPFAPLDLAYYATKDINPGEELYVYYGVDWDIFVENCINIEGLLLPLNECLEFRHPLIAPDSLFPQSWLLEHEL